MKKLTLALSVLSLSIAASFAQADTMSQDQKVSGFYVGGAVGQAQQKSFADHEHNWDKDHSTSTETSLQLLGGYQFNRIVAIELAYADYGNLEKEDGSKWSSPTTFTTQANLGYTFHSGWRPFALAGLSVLDLNAPTGSFADDKDSTIAVRSGLGVEFSPAALNGLAFRASWNADFFVIETPTPGAVGGSNSVHNTNMLSNLSIGVTYKF